MAIFPLLFSPPPPSDGVVEFERGAEPATDEVKTVEDVEVLGVGVVVVVGVSDVDVKVTVTGSEGIGSVGVAVTTEVTAAVAGGAEDAGAEGDGWVVEGAVWVTVEVC